MISRPLLWTLLTVAFLGGVFVGATPVFNIEERLSAGDILNLLGSFIIAIVLSVIFQRQFSEARVEKELIIGQVKETASVMRVTRDLFLRAYTEGTTLALAREIIASLRNVSNQLYALERAAEECEVDYRDTSLTRARQHYRECRSVLTERALVLGSSYTPEDYAAAEQRFGAFSHALLKFSIRMNKK